MSETKPTAAEIAAEPAGRRMDGWIVAYVLNTSRYPARYSTNKIDAFCVLDYLQRSDDIDYSEWSIEYKYGCYYDVHVLVTLGENTYSARGLGDTMALAICRALLALFCVEMA